METGTRRCDDFSMSYLVLFEQFEINFFAVGDTNEASWPIWFMSGSTIGCHSTPGTSVWCSFEGKSIENQKFNTVDWQGYLEPCDTDSKPGFSRSRFLLGAAMRLSRQRALLCWRSTISRCFRRRKEHGMEKMGRQRDSTARLARPLPGRRAYISNVWRNPIRSTRSQPT